MADRIPASGREPVDAVDPLDEGRASFSRASPSFFAAALATSLIPLFIAFSLWTLDDGWSFARFLGAVALVAYVPGRFLLESGNLKPRGLDGLLLSCLTGLMASALAYWLFARLGLRSAWLLWPAAALILQALRSARRPRPPVLGRPIHLGLAAAYLLVSAPLALTPVLFRNLVKLPEGGVAFYWLPDVVLHASLANELRRSIPPQNPFQPGTALNYHVGPDLLASLFADVARVSTVDLTLRFLPALFMALVVVAVFCFARLWLKSERGALLAVVLVVLGEDLSWVPGLLTESPRAWASSFFGVPTIASPYMANPMLPALAVLFAIFLCLARLLRGEGRSWGILAACLLVGSMEVKIFTAAHALGCLALAAAVQAGTRRDFALLRVAAFASVLAVPFAWSMLGDGAARFEIGIGGGAQIATALVRSGLGETGFGRSVIGFVHVHEGSAGALAFFGVALPGFLIASFGARSIGLVTILRRHRIPDAATLGRLRILLAAFVLTGPMATLLFTLTPAGYDPARVYDNAVWFFVQSKFVAWIFAVEALIALTRGRARAVRVGAVLLVLALSLPSSVQFVHSKWASSTDARRSVLSEAALEAFRQLDELAPPGAVVLAPEGIATTIIALTDCRAPSTSLYPSSFLAPAELEDQKAQMRAFWQDWVRGGVPRDVIRAWQASFVMMTRAEAHPRLAPLFANSEFAIYRVPPDISVPSEPSDPSDTPDAR